MKYILTLFFISQMCQILFAQNLVEEGKTWSVGYFASQGNSVNTICTKIGGDTIYNNVPYQKLFECQDKEQKLWSLKSLIRQDQKKVYLKELKSDDEKLLYDFGLMPSDTFEIKDAYVTLTLDSINVVDGLRYFYFHYYNWKTRWIEGIGSTVGLLNNHGNLGVVGYTAKLLCCFNDTITYYHNPNYSDCYLYITGVDKLHDRNGIGVYANESGYLYMKLNDRVAGKITFLTPDGKQVLSATLVEPKTTLCAPSTGLLLYRFVSTNGQVQTGKVVVR
jgi:hypothetical protein